MNHQANIQEWVQKCREHDRAAQEQVYLLLFPLMYQAARKYVDGEHDILSVVNDGFLKACKHIQLYASELGPFESWLRTIVCNTALDHLRHHRRQPVLAPVNEDMPLSDNTHLKVVPPEHLRRLIAELPPLTRSVLSLNIDGFTHREISGLLHISESASRWHLSEAKKRLRAQLQRTAKCSYG